MAAPPPVPLASAALIAVVEAAAGGNFDQVLSPQIQLTPDGPPRFAAQTHHNAPPPFVPGAPPAYVPGGPYPACNDRAHHATVAGYPAGPAANPTHPCLDGVGFPGAPLAPPGVAAPPGTVAPVCPVDLGVIDLPTCSHPAGPLHPAGFTVCRHCLFDIRNQSWSQIIFGNVTAPPLDLPRKRAVPAAPLQPLTPADAAIAGVAVYTRFMTPLCLECERQEIRTLVHRVNTFAPPPIERPNWATVRDYAHGQSWPYVTCICLRDWQAGAAAFTDLCIRHRHQDACRDHDERLIVRAQNDKWLRETSRDPDDPTSIIRLRQNNRREKAIMSARRKRGAFRGCRCGGEPVTGPPEVYMCLGCEGVIHTGPPVAFGAPMPIPATLEKTTTRRQKAAAAAGVAATDLYPLRRPRINDV